MAQAVVVAAIAAGKIAAGTTAAVLATTAAAVVDLAITSAYQKKKAADARKEAASAPRDVTVRSAIEPARIIYGKARTSGPVVYTNTQPTPGTNDNSTLWTAISLANHECASIEEIWLDGDQILWSQLSGTGGVTSGKYGPINTNEVTNFYAKLGTPSQTALSELVSAFNDWTSSYTGQDITYIVSAFELGTATGEGVWAQGAPNNIRAVVKGKKVYDPRKDSTNGGSGTHRLADPTTWEWSDNPALCLADYLFDDRLGLGAEGVTYNDIDWSMVADAADDCDVTVTTPAGNQKRFTCNGVLSTGSTYADNIRTLVSSMNGMLTWTGGKYRIRACAYEAPTYTFTEDDIVGDVQVQPERTRSQRFNTIRGTYIDPDSDYNSTEFIPVTNSSYQTTRDGGQKLTTDIALPMTNDEYMAQRLAYKALNLNNQQTTAVIPVNWKALKVGVGDRIQVTLSELSWSNKIFVVEGWSFEPDKGFMLSVKEDSSSAYADPGLSDYSTRTLAGTVTFADQPVAAPSGLQATSEEEAILLEWEAPPRGSGYDEVVVYASADSSWSNATEISRTRSTSFRHELTNGTTRYYWVRSVDVDGEFSIRDPDSDTSTVTATAGQISTSQLNDDADFALTADWPNVSDSAGTRPVNNATNNGTTINASGDIVAQIEMNTSGKLFAGKSTFGSGTGWLLEYNGGTPRFEVGDSSANYMSWNGTTLTVRGTLNADDISAGTIDADRLSVDGVTIDTNGSGQLIIKDGGVDSTQLADGAVTAGKIGDGEVSITKFASGITPVQVVDSLPGTATQGDQAFLTTDNKLYRYNGTSWVASIPLADVTGTGALAALDDVTLAKVTDAGALAALNDVTLSLVTDAGALAALDDVTLSLVTDAGTLAGRNDIDLSFVTDSGTLAGRNDIDLSFITDAGSLAALNNIDLSYVTDAGNVASLDTITETYIGNNAVTTDKINANAVTAAKIAAATITSNEIASNTIIAGNIAAATITAAEIAGNTITAAQIAANTITAAQIAAGAIVTSKLAVTARGAALNSDPNMQDSSAWSLFGGNAGTFEEITDGVVGNNVLRSGTPSSAGSWYNGSEKLALDPSKTYRMTGLARKSATANGTLYFGVAAFDDSGNNISGDGTQWSYGAAVNDSGSTDWTRYTMEFGAGTARTFPANAVTFSPIVILNYASTTGYFEAQDVRIEEKVNSSLIVDGAVITDKLAANAVTAAKIAAGTITAAEIAAATITGAKIAANTIAAANIAANTITANEIASNTITAGQIAAGAIGATEIAANAVTADKINVTNLAAITADLGTVTAGSLSAGLITGDVNENFPFWTADEAYLNTTDTSFTMVEMTTPAPSGGVSKRPSFDAHLNYQNRNVSARAEVIMRIQVKAESATGVSLGAIATVQDGIGEDSGDIVYKWYGISGNHLDKLGVGGEISTSSNGSTATSTVQGVKYDGTYTYVLVDTDLDTSYSVGTTLYYSWTSFNSVGTFSTVATVFSSTVGETGFQENSMSVSVHGPKTTTGKDFRMTFSRVSGTTLHLLTTGSAGYIR